ncbi:hypothetical protein [Bacillus albus]|uniref:hypothetical protein n=1 Tax=Bacillus albus TaxID=2026189 RepID=UPI0018A14394|nr:hypothetical protein [Bacillus albus]MBF7155064.1 hypothetical protein [Bacillus albus]
MDYLTGLLTECENNVIELSAIETTTSDFRAYLDLGAEKVKELACSKHNKVVRFLDSVFNKSLGEKAYKHTAIFEGEVHSLKLNQTGKNINKDFPEADLYKGTENGHVIAHINGNIVDNCAENLQWVKVC